MSNDEFEKDVKTELEPFEESKEVIEVEQDHEVVVSSGDIDEDKEEKDLKTDFQYVRTNLYGVIEKGNEALEELIHFAKETQSPRAFEVIAKLMDSISNSNEKIIDNYQKIKNINKSKDKDSKHNQSAGTINNIMFNGTTEQLFDAIETAKKKKEE